MTGTTTSFTTIFYPLSWGETLSNHEWFELHIHRLLKSRLVAGAIREGRREDIATALLLWTESFVQDPAGTLPSDDLELMDLARYSGDAAGWEQAKRWALHGWVPVHVGDDEDRAQDRLGHPFIIPIVERMWKRKSGREQGREAAKLAVTRSRVKKKLAALGQKRLAGNREVIASVADWLDTSNLYITDENVMAALEMIGVPRIVGGTDGGSHAHGR
ncbi:DUF1376 domain-containing protein [Frigidibacter sp. MR17.24]|uniref:DUF1376 domain-containing protein n=1 Tax=Frigidibacter sp. MR17.24 TaxID=3127345 RepID=UPI003012D1A1